METFSPKLDKISENIIYLLSVDARTTISKLSRVLAKPRKIIEHRVQKLYRNGFIKPLLVYNYPSLYRATILIKLSYFDKKVIETIRTLNPLIKLKETLGMYDLSLLVISDTKEDIQKTINTINNLCHPALQNLEIIHHDLEDTLGYKSFCHNLLLLQKYDLCIPHNAMIFNQKKKQFSLCSLKHPLSAIENLFLIQNIVIRKSKQ